MKTEKCLPVCAFHPDAEPCGMLRYLQANRSRASNWYRIRVLRNPKIIKEGVSKSRMVYSGDFLLTNSMSFGRPYILKTDGCIHDGWLVLSDPHGIFIVDYLYYLLSSPFAYYQFCDSVSGAVVKNLNSEKVAESLFPIPPINEQKRIAKRIEEILPIIEGA